MSNVPVVRFSEFDDEWVEEKIENFAEKFIGGGTPKTSELKYWEKGNIPWFQSSDLEEGKLQNINYKKKITNDAILKSSSKLIPANSIMVVTRVGVGKLAFVSYEYSTSQDFLSLTHLRHNKDFSLYSLFLLLQKAKANLQGTSIKGITKEEILSKKINIPSLPEQTKIGDFFKLLDDTIALHQKELDALKQAKQGFLQKMFPADGEKVPKIRFPEFSDDWVETKLGEVFEYERPDKYIVKSEDYISDGIPVLTANKSFILGYTSEENVYNKNNAIIFDDFTLDNKYVDFPFMVKSSAIKILTTKDKYDIKFSYELLNNTKIATEGHTRHYISVVQGISVKIPQNKEQIKIGNFFRQLDKSIELEEQKLDDLKNAKKSFLQKMFI